jgi:hypothetical protein
MPYIYPMQTVLLTTTFLKQAVAAGLEDEGIEEIVGVIARNPLAGDLIAGSGGARKLRHPAPGRGKSGGYRTIHYFGGLDVPVFLLAIYGKSEKANISKAERNELAKVLPTIAANYREHARKLR